MKRIAENVGFGLLLIVSLPLLFVYKLCRVARGREIWVSTERAVEIVSDYLRENDGWTYVLTLEQETRLSVGTLYPTLSRLEGAGKVEHSWQTDPKGNRRMGYRWKA